MLKHNNKKEMRKVKKKEGRLCFVERVLSLKSRNGNHLGENWGECRPDWHIECSTMASSILGQKLDIHAGILTWSSLIMKTS